MSHNKAEAISAPRKGLVLETSASGAPKAYERHASGRTVGIVLGLSVLLYSVLLRLPSLGPDTPVHTDAPPFLQVLALLRGEWAGPVAPFRGEFPLYPYLIFFANRFVPDWLLAAKWAAFIPSALVPLAVFFGVYLLSRERWPAFFAGFLAASSPALIRAAAAPLYDSTFTLTLALLLLAGIWLLQSQSWRAVALVGLALGVSLAARGLGVFLFVPMFSVIGLLPAASVGRKLAYAALAIATSLGTAYLIAQPVRRASAGLQPDRTNCLRQVISDGILYSEGDRDANVYRLNDAATAFQMDESGVCDMGWGQFVRNYGKAQTRMFAENLKGIILYELVAILTPFLVFFIPLTMGAKYLSQPEWRPYALLLGATCLSFLVFVPAIQYQDRYLVPLMVPVAMAAGLGCVQLLQAGNAARLLLAVLLIAALVAGIDGFRRTAVPDQAETNYRSACEWIVSEGGAKPFSVMERHHGVYAYLKQPTVFLPVDEAARVRQYAAHMNVKYVLAGPDERQHNPRLFVEGSFLHSVKSFGSGAQTVAVLEIVQGS